MAVKRTEHFNFDTSSPRNGATTHEDSLVDTDDYFRRLDEARGSTLYTWGVSGGLRVSATLGQAGLTVQAGTALDAAGRVSILDSGGFAIVDPNADPEQLLNVPTVVAGVEGLTLTTAGVPPGTYLLVLTWREVVGESRAIRLHAPWLRLLPAAGFENAGKHVVLAEVTLAADGTVSGLAPGLRRTVGVPVERVELRCPQSSTGSPTTVGQVPAAELRAKAGGGADLTVFAADGTAHTVLSAAGDTGRVGIGTDSPSAMVQINAQASGVHGLRISTPVPGSGIELVNDGSGPVYAMFPGADGGWHLRNESTETELLVVSADGALTVTGGLNVGNDLSATGGLNVGNDLSVAGGLNVSNDLSVAGALNVSNDLNVTGGLNVSNDLNVTGGLNVSNDLNVTGGLNVDNDLNVTGGLNVSNDLDVTGGLSVGNDLSVASGLSVEGSTDMTGGLSVADTVRIGTDESAEPQLNVHGGGIHSGGGGGGLSFADRALGDFVTMPSNGERWVWYAFEGSARLWSGEDLISIGHGGGNTLDVRGRMRARQGAADDSAGIWFHQLAPDEDRAFVGMENDTSVGFWGNTGAGFGMVMDTGTGRVTCRRGLTVEGEAAFGMHFGRRGAEAVLHLHGSVIQDRNDGILNLQSGGSVIALSGSEDLVGIGTITPQFKLDVNGSMRVTGNVFKGGGGFMIDHPLDPANKYLAHSFVESPEMATFYGGVVETDERGEATVDLPEYFEALNRDFRYQLTPVGTLAQAAVTGEIEDNRFTLRTDKPGVKVSWQVTGVRQDAWAEAHRIRTEEDKPQDHRSFYLHPEEHGQPESAGLLAHLEGTHDDGSEEL
ncbi:hypothetical protein [Streptomyces sp. NBC_01565]|uniref:hypothetical protein n=1 Tax=Streptomyces sp. NBC_01565 TaxID=2975881 RepID=UPI0022552F0C|nr:hypothetical protein [Streptomyces sp. NBC_01565]MCX4545581.1 hypothetical protein [Streptomyces sp. NBC_01565]